MKSLQVKIQFDSDHIAAQSYQFAAYEQDFPSSRFEAFPAHPQITTWDPSLLKRLQVKIQFDSNHIAAQSYQFAAYERDFPSSRFEAFPAHPQITWGMSRLKKTIITRMQHHLPQVHFIWTKRDFTFWSLPCPPSNNSRGDHWRGCSWANSTSSKIVKPQG